MAQMKDGKQFQLFFQRDILILVPEDLLQSIPESCAPPLPPGQSSLETDGFFTARE